MLRDVFYYGAKPNAHPREQPAKNLADARNKCTTDHFWIINEFCDYRNFDWDFDFDFLPDRDVWAEEHINVWPSQHQKDSGTWLCASKVSDIIIYRTDVNPLVRKNEINDNWKLLEKVDIARWNFSWHPDPTDPPYIYRWGCKFFPVEIKACIEYHVDGANNIKYMKDIVPLLPDYDCIKEYDKIDHTKFDMSWRPNPIEPPFIYVWGNKYVSGELRPTLEYHTPGATQKKYMGYNVPVQPEWDRWNIIENVDKTKFDFSWRPDPREPDFIYVFGNDQHGSTIMPTLEYHVPGATIKKYVTDVKAKLLPNPSKFTHLENSYGIDYSWVPDPTSPPYIYAWGNQWNKPEDKISIQYVVEGATEYKYMSERAIRKPCLDNWVIPKNIDASNFDFSWEPSPADPPYIYEFGTQWQKTGGPRYIVEGATEVKYIEIQKAKSLPDKSKWKIPNHIDTTNFDFSWHPDSTSPPYVYHFATQWALSGGPTYTVEGAIEVKYMEEPCAIALPNRENWEIPEDINVDEFDFSWHPYVEDQPYVYQFGTQWQKTGGPRYVTPGVIPSSPIKYIDTRILHSIKYENKNNFSILNNYKIKDFDWSWHPDDTEEPYIYVFGNNQYPAEIMPTIEYIVEGATEVKYINNIIAILDEDRTNWEIPNDIDLTTFDFSWKPNPKDPPYIYEFGTQWQKTGGPRYIVETANEVKYIDTQKVKALPDKSKWIIPNHIDTTNFDFSWHPDSTSPPYVYHFATQWALSGGPTYKVQGATEIKYMEEPCAVALPNKENWEIPKDVDIESFDFSWHPYVEDQPYVYQFGTQWQKTGGPRYITPGAIETSPIKYIDTRILKSKKLSNRKNFSILNNYKIKDFDWSWHPDDSEEPYIYVFGNNQYPAEIMPTIEYVVPGATQIKYINDIIAILDIDMDNWNIPDHLDVDGFDFSWKPNPKDPPYIYEFGTQWQKTGGPRYVIPGATETKYITTQKVKALPNRNNWELPKNIDVKDFDFSWHPDSTSPPYVYHFATQWALSGGPIYRVSNAIESKYMEEPCAVVLPNRENWEIPKDVDIESFDFSWHPYVEDMPYIYQFGTQHQKTGGPRYITPGVMPTSPIKYIDTRILKSKKLHNKKNFTILNNYKIKDFDWSWHPDDTEEPYIYVFGNNQYPAEIMPTVEYVVKGAKKIKYVHDVVATLDVDMNNWEVPDNVDTGRFDFSWKPNPKDPPYIYQFGTQHQKTGGPRYITPGVMPTSPIKYIDTRISKTKKLSNRKNFSILNNYKIKDFDWSWHPDDTEEPYIYVFGNNQYPAEIMPTIEYVVPGATQIKYIYDLNATLDIDMTNWVVPKNLNVSEFDFSWKPNPKDPPYIYEFGTQWQKTGGPRYVIPGATETKYVDGSKAKALPNTLNWVLPDNIIIEDFDYSWHPDSTEIPYTYVFPTQWQPTAGPKYLAPGAKEIKYMKNPCAKAGKNLSNWVVPDNIVIKDFDFSWHPHPDDPLYVYEFGTQWNDRGGPKYIPNLANNKTPIKYIDTNVNKATLGPNNKNWQIPEGVVIKDFDFSWVPHPDDPVFIYEFGTQWNDRGGPKYIPNLANNKTPIKYIDTNVNKATLGPNKSNYEIPSNVSIKDFDFSWVPHPDDPVFIYEFGTQHQKTGGPRYKVSGASIVKYIDHPKLKGKRSTSQENWSNPNNSDVSTFDFSWHPDDTSPPYIYQFGTLLDPNDGPRYTTPNYVGEVVYLQRIEKLQDIVEPNNVEEVIEPIKVNKYYIETTLEDLVAQHKNEVFWALNKNIDYTSFDFDWRPESIRDMEYVQVFGSPDSEMTHTYFVSANSYLSGNKSYKFITNVSLNETSLANIFIKPDIFFVDKGNKESQYRFDNLKLKYNIQKTRFLNSWVDTINRCINRSTTELCWILNSELDYTNFDFNYYPNPWQMKMVHVFGTQWNHWGTTFLINRETFPRDTKYIKIIEHLNNLNFVKDRIALASSVTYDIFYINHGNLSETELTSLTDSDHIVDYENDYLTTFKKILSQLPEKKDHYIWIANTICDYSNFDFTYICDPFARDQLHVFPSDKQKFGDTFFVNVNKLREYIETMSTLKDYKDINYNQAQRVKRLPAPTIVTAYDSHVLSVMEEFNFPYATFITEDNKHIDIREDEPISIWDAESKTILITSTGGTRIVVPKEVKNYVETQLYDYPYIKTSTRLAKSNPLDIVFLSNGEKCADANYEHLLKVTKGLPNKITRVDGVNGRVAAYQSAAKASNTPWFFTVFAKLKINTKFDFNWQPDRLQIPKHYMFLAKNPVNGLIYGHQGLIAYNSQLVLNNFGEGLDFTLDSPNETIELLSGTATFNTDEFSTWRTAFREVIKLKNENSEISNKRLDIWLTKAEGDFAEYSLLGAKDGISFYKKCKGDLDLLRQSYEWKWLQEFYNKKRKKK